MVRARNVARPAGSGSHAGRGLDHGADHFRVLAHTEVVVGAPNDDIARALWRMPHPIGKMAGKALQIGKDAITPLTAQSGDRIGKKVVIVHGAPPKDFFASNGYRDGNISEQFPNQLNRESPSRPSVPSRRPCVISSRKTSAIRSPDVPVSKARTNLPRGSTT